MSASVSLIRHAQSLAMATLPAGAGVPDWAEGELSHDLDPSEPGLLSLLGTVPGGVGISLLPYTAFDRGWLLVQRADADRVQTLWEQPGFTITTPEDQP